MRVLSLKLIGALEKAFLATVGVIEEVSSKMELSYLILLKLALLPLVVCIWHRLCEQLELTCLLKVVSSNFEKLKVACI
jgi:hypothetical protein